MGSRCADNTYFINIDSPLSVVIDHYLTVVSPLKKGHTQEIYRAKPIKHLLGDMKFGEVSQLHIAEYRDERLATPHPKDPKKTLSGSTVRLELMFLSNVYTVATIEWGVNIDNPVAKVRKPKPSPGRTRRLSQKENLVILKKALTYQNKELYPIVVIALETAMRQGEIVDLRWENISWKKKVAHLPQTKNGTARDVPFSSAAIHVLRHHMTPKQEGKVFSYSQSGLKSTWRQFVNALKIEDLHFHDLRHEAISRLFEKGLDIMEVATISGHKSLAMLKRYTHLQAYKLVPKLDPKKRGKKDSPKELREFIVAYPAVIEKRSKKCKVDFYDFIGVSASARCYEDAVSEAKNQLLRKIVTMLHNGEVPPKPTENLDDIEVGRRDEVILIHPL